ncbi:unnamed protein product [Cuscuta campestris]|uniref:DUF4218 domain-containing protein n=1 Tax=Cuscuta campestris TaxID=132261 RepID=A0A484NJ28_9ASTE|nr:unnamed protein product [Cuscuta campestris]
MVKNKARVEGSIANAYIVREASHFCSHYFEDYVYTRLHSVPRNDEGDVPAAIESNLSIFQSAGRLSGKTKKRRLSDDELKALHHYLMLNSVEIEPFIEKYVDSLRDSNPDITDEALLLQMEESFASWMHNDESMDSDESIEHEHDDAMNLGPSVAYFDRSGSVVFTEEGARIICSTFQQRLDPTGGSWKSQSDTTVDFYWREFKKHATWDPRIDDSVMFRAWQSKARRRYTDWLSSIRNEKKGTEKVQPLVPQSWKEYWKSPKFLASSKQNKKNRRGGDENAPASATHTGGPLSFRETQARLGKSGKASDLYSLYTHTYEET